MGSKYVSNTISGYNSTPPSDDGAVSEANKVKWSTIKNKLTDPSKVLAEAINTDIATALDYGPISVVSAAVTLGASHNNQFIELSGASTPTLNSADGLGAGWFCDVKNIGSSVITVARTKSGDMINDVTADVTMNPLDYIRFVVNAAASGFQTIQVKKATQAEVDAGTVSDAFVTPEALEPPEVSGYVGVRTTYVRSDGAEPLGLNIAGALSANTWESVGPTGSGADNTWSSLDVIPTDASLVTLRIQSNVSGSTIGVSYSSIVYGRIGGGSGGATNSTTIAQIRFKNQSGSAEELYAVNTVDLALDANNIFDARWLATGTGVSSTHVVWVTGYKK